MTRTAGVTTIILLLALPCLVSAAQGNGVELTPTVGYRWGGEILAEDSALLGYDVEVEDSATYGFVLDIPVTSRIMIELMADRQSTELGERDLFSEARWQPDVDLSYYHVGVVWQWYTESVNPFVVGSVGVAQIAPDIAGVGSESRFSASVGGGFKIDLSEHFGFRLEARGFWADTDDGWGDDWWDDEWCGGHCWDGDDDLVQGQIKTGFTFSF